MNDNSLPFFLLNNTEFDVFISSNIFNSSYHMSDYRLSVRYLESKTFRQYVTSVNSYESSLHPDLNFFNNLSQDFATECKYYFSDSCDFKEESNKNNFSILTLNINSIPKNLDSFETQFLAGLGYEFKVLGLVETKLTDDIKSLYQLHSYSQYTLNNTRNSGGLALYCHSSLEIIPREDLNRKTVFMEALFVEVVSDGKNKLVGLIYHRPNTNKNDFLSMLEDILSTLMRENKLVYLSGDFNIDLLNKDSSLPSKNLINLFNSLNFVSLINNPTRVTNNSATIIDHIWTNDYSNVLYNGLFYDFTSDHFPIFSIFRNKPIDISHNTAIKETLTYRSFCNDNVMEFKNDLQAINWDECLRGSDTNEIFDNFSSVFSGLFEQNFPKLTKTVKKRRKDKPYITQEIKILMKERDCMQKKYAKHPLTYDEQFKRLRNQVTNKIRKAKHQYYKNILDSSSGDTKKTWSVINQIIRPNDENKNKTNKFSNPTNPDEVINDDRVICEMFNDYYVNAGRDLSDSIIENNIPITHYLGDRVTETLNFRCTDEVEVSRLIAGLSDSAAGVDEIPAKVIKQVSNEITPPLTQIFNRSMNEGIFPNQFKTSKVTPIFKKGNKQEVKNYRPISVLPCLSKVLEKLIHDRLIEFITQNQIISDAQHGFQRQKSTTSAVLALTDDILKSFDAKKFTIALFLDLSKAFETVNHNILIEKLEHYGIRETALKWFASYLENRSQIVKYKSELSSLKGITLSVLQWSLLGPTLFNICINDLPSNANCLKKGIICR